jgi:hypothetical protein
MPVYHFNLNDGHRVIHDPDGTALADQTSAHIHACHVARELMRNSERQRRFWRLSVCDVLGNPFFELPFASVSDAVPNSSSEPMKDARGNNEHTVPVTDAP